MIYERVVETVCNCSCKCFAVGLVERQDRDDFIEEHLVHESADRVVVHAVTNDILTCEISAENKASVCAVQDADFALLVRNNIRYDMDVEAGFLERKLLLEPFRTFDVPYAEDFADIEKRIGVAVLLLESSDFLCVTDASGNDSVDERGAEEVLIFDPCCEIIAEFPVCDMLLYALLEFLAVRVDQLAGEDDDTLLAGFEALVKEDSQLGREGVRRQLIKG